MPIYEYQCQACGQHHEAMQKMSEPALKKCPHCGKATLRRLISAPVFRLKGSGWYETDFKSDQETKRNLHAEEAKAGKAEATDKKTEATAAKAEGKAETKAEAKAKTKAEAKPQAKASAAKSSPRGKKPARKVARRR